MDTHTLIIFVGNYCATTLNLWFGHWFSHVKRSPLAGFHVSGHHAFYPDSGHMRSDAFIYGAGRSSSIFAFLPWLVLQAGIQLVVLPPRTFLLCFVETALIVAALNYLHTQFHLTRSRLEGFRWFRVARQRHEVHHDRDINYMVGDHFWDRRFGTYVG